MKKVIVCLFPRTRYAGTAAAKLYFPANREKLMRDLGGASSVILHTRVYDRSGTGSPVIDFDFNQGSLGDEPPAQSLRAFSLTKTSMDPSLPYNAVNMPNTPDDGTVTVTPTMGLLDVSMKVSGSASVWVEVEVWATLVYL